MSNAVIRPIEWHSELTQIEQRGQDYPWSEATLRSCFGDPHYQTWGLFLPHLAGFAIAHSILDEMTIMNIVVDPTHRGQGYGFELLNTVLQLALERGQMVWLEVRASNQAAQKLYQKVGFEVVAERADYYRTATGTEAAIVMKWTQ